jgi:hypothetical protein
MADGHSQKVPEADLAESRAEEMVVFHSYDRCYPQNFLDA